MLAHEVLDGFLELRTGPDVAADRADISLDYGKRSFHRAFLPERFMRYENFYPTVLSYQHQPVPAQDASRAQQAIGNLSFGGGPTKRRRGMTPMEPPALVLWFDSAHHVINLPSRNVLC